MDLSLLSAVYWVRWMEGCGGIRFTSYSIGVSKTVVKEINKDTKCCNGGEVSGIIAQFVEFGEMKPDEYAQLRPERTCVGIS